MIRFYTLQRTEARCSNGCSNHPGCSDTRMAPISRSMSWMDYVSFPTNPSKAAGPPPVLQSQPDVSTSPEPGSLSPSHHTLPGQSPPGAGFQIRHALAVSGPRTRGYPPLAHAVPPLSRIEISILLQLSPPTPVLQGCFP